MELDRPRPAVPAGHGRGRLAVLARAVGPDDDGVPLLSVTWHRRKSVGAWVEDRVGVFVGVLDDAEWLSLVDVAYA